MTLAWWFHVGPNDTPAMHPDHHLPRLVVHIDLTPNVTGMLQALADLSAAARKFGDELRAKRDTDHDQGDHA